MPVHAPRLVLKPPHPFEPELVHIPAGDFLMGTRETEIPMLLERYGGEVEWYQREVPRHTIYLPDYYIARTPTTVAQFQAFVETSRYKPSDPASLRGRADDPVVYVDWYDAIAYCRWLAQVTGRPYMLPSEAEWEKAARGTDGRQYPWGDEFAPTRCNTRESGARRTTPVGQYSPDGNSPYGCVDMAGNVWERTRSLYEDYPYESSAGREDLEANEFRTARGGAWLFPGYYARCSSRYWLSPTLGDLVFGFRVSCPSLIEST